MNCDEGGLILVFSVPVKKRYFVHASRLKPNVVLRCIYLYSSYHKPHESQLLAVLGLEHSNNTSNEIENRQ